MAVYIFERIDITGGGRGKFIELIRSTWARYAELRHGVRLAGVWATIGSTGAWPEANLMWEMDDWDHFAAASAATYPMEDKDLLLNEMWRQALAWRSGGKSALLVPSDSSPTVADLKSGAGPGRCLFMRIFRRCRGGWRRTMPRCRRITCRWSRRGGCG